MQNSYRHLQVNERGHLTIEGQEALSLARRFGTPLWVLSERAIRERCGAYRQALADFWSDSAVAYAGKALLPLAICRLMDEENMWLDVASGGELYAAQAAGFPAERMMYHGNNKSIEEIRMGLLAGVGRFICDNFEELDRIDELSRICDHRPSVLLRITPGIDTRTHRYIATGHSTSKFGFHLADGQALRATKRVLSSSQMRLAGFHCHLGSQLTDVSSLLHGVEVMCQFMAEIRQVTGYIASELNIGGGLGIAYTESDRPPNIRSFVQRLTSTLKTALHRHDLPAPRLWLEPGRSVVGEAGLTLYTIGSIKTLSADLTYLLVDGGMADNPRPALYQARYRAALAHKAAVKGTETVHVAGKCCESGDVLIHNVCLPTAQPGDILAVFCTGAYNHSMASNYNRLPRPAMVLVNGKDAQLIVARQSYADLLCGEIIPHRLSARNQVAAGQ